MGSTSGENSSSSSYDTTSDSSSSDSDDICNEELHCEKNDTSERQSNKRQHVRLSKFETYEKDSESEEEQLPPKKIALEFSSYSNKSIRMMENMGYQHTKGLGISGDGITEPIIPSEQKGRRGFGLELRDFNVAAGKFKSTNESIQIKETVKWLADTTNDSECLSRDTLNSWLKEGIRKFTIDDEDKFCNPRILKEMLESKTIFDQIDRKELMRARGRCNPFETIRKSIFLNRAAVKMANMDALFNFMFTDPKDENGKSMVEDLLYFADVCAGPGGFSDYVLWRKKWLAKGFGFTLRNEEDFKLDEFLAGNSETFEPYYGTKENGNIFDPENIVSLQRYVLNQTNQLGVHFMMADGGFHIDEKNIQEITSKQLYLCQCLTALSLVRKSGHFVVKLFDCFTLFTTGLIYLIYKCFKQICIIKPNSSRPGNSERYLVCKFKKDNTDSIFHHLFAVNKRMFENEDSNNDTMELVPYEIMKADPEFFNYIYESNNIIGKNQINSLRKIAAFCNDTNLVETRQGDIRRDCQKLWMLPQTHQRNNMKRTVCTTFEVLMGDWMAEKDFLLASDRPLTYKTNDSASKLLSRIFRDRSFWYFVPIYTIEPNGKNIRTFFMSRGGRDVYYYSKGSWMELQNIVLEICAQTLIYGEIVTELCGEGKSQTVTYSLHIIDGVMLGGIDIRHLQLKDRVKMCEKFANSLNKPSRPIISGATQMSTSSITSKRLYELMDFHLYFNELSHYTLKDGKIRFGLRTRNKLAPERFYVPRGLIFFNKMKPHIESAFSKTHNKMYFVDKKVGNTFFQDQIKDPEAIYSSFKTTFINRYLWEWQFVHQVYENVNTSDKMSGYFYREDFTRCIYQQ